MPEHVMSSFLVDQGATNGKAEEDNTNAGTGKKVRRKQPLVKKAATSSNPANMKRRGRKRKYPLPNPNEGPSETPQHVPVPSTGQFPESVVKVCGPGPLPNTVTQGQTSNKNNLNNQQQNPTESSLTVNHNHHSSAALVSGLDVLAAVSYVLKQQDMNVLSGARDVPSKSETKNANQLEQINGIDKGISGTQKTKNQTMEENDQQQDYEENHQVYDVIPGAEVQVEGQESQQTLLPMQNQPLFQKQASDHDHLAVLTQQSQSAASPLSQTTQNPQEYVIVGPAEHEVVL